MMILADTSVWIDYFKRGGSAELGRRLQEQQIVMHPMVLGELTLGGLANRRQLLDDLRMLREAAAASVEEILVFIEVESLAGSGIGYVDAALLASVRLLPGTKLWTRDRRLASVSTAMAVGFDEA